jgi:hypothetical protein
MHVDVEAGVIAEGEILGLIHCHKCTNNNIISLIPSPEQSEDHGLERTFKDVHFSTKLSHMYWGRTLSLGSLLAGFVSFLMVLTWKDGRPLKPSKVWTVR